MKLLITGANGLVGSRLVKHLVRAGHSVVATGRGAQRLTGDGFRYVSLELADAAGIERCVAEHKPDAIINPAGMTDVDGCERNPDAAYVANVEGVAALARAAKAHGAHLVHVSTDYVFDGEAGPYNTEAIPNPRGTYACTKLMGELAVKSLCPAGTWAIARTAVVYGWPRAGNNNFGSWLVDTFRQGKPAKLFEDQWVSPSLALNVAEMLAELAEKKLSGVWNIAGADVVDRVTFGKALCAEFGFDAALVTPSRMKDVALLSPRPAKSGLDVSKTAQALSHQPLSLSASLKRFHQEVQEHT